MIDNRKTMKNKDTISEPRFTRRKYLTAATASTAGLSLLAGCSSVLGENNGVALEANVPEGTPATVETKYWHDWPTLDEETQADGPPLDYTARAGAPLDPVSLEFSSEDNPWMKQHVLMVKDGINSLGTPTRLVDRPLNQLYAQSWTTAGLEHMISMSTHGPDPQRGLNPNPLLMRRYKENSSNYDNYWHPKLNELLPEQSRITGDKERRAELVKQCESIFAEDVGGIITIFPDVITAANTRKISWIYPNTW